MTINACGGISCADDVVQTLENGADTVQIYTALVYEGPGLVKKINRDLSRILRSRSLDSIRALSSIRVPRYLKLLHPVIPVGAVREPPSHSPHPAPPPLSSRPGPPSAT